VKRVILVEWIDASTIEARLAVRDDDSTKAILVHATVMTGTGQMGAPSIWRCDADVNGERCRVLGGNSAHVDVTAAMIEGTLTAYNEGGQEGLMAHLEQVL
jgi:hypothetical protein